MTEDGRRTVPTCVLIALEWVIQQESAKVHQCKSVDKVSGPFTPKTDANNSSSLVFASVVNVAPTPSANTDLQRFLDIKKHHAASLCHPRRVYHILEGLLVTFPRDELFIRVEH